MQALATYRGLGEPDELYEDEGRRVSCWIREGRVFLCRAEGSMTAVTSNWANAVCDRLVEQHGRLYLFNDWSAVTQHESACRVIMTKWAFRNLKHIVAGHYYVGSAPVLTMSVELAAMVLRGLHLHPDLTSFMAVFRETCAYVNQKDAVATV